MNPTQLCSYFLNGKCNHGDKCKYVHDPTVCRSFWKRENGCKHGVECKYKHIANPNPKKEENPKPLVYGGVNIVKRPTLIKGKNTETWIPKRDPCDARIVYDGGHTQLTKQITSRDICIVPNVFSDYPAGRLYNQIMSELQSIENSEGLLRKWHGNQDIEGTHLIVDDRKKWKQSVPTFGLIIKRLEAFFRMRIEATRLNIYQNTADFKPFHHDSAAKKEEKANRQNFTVALSLGVTRDAAFEHAKTKTTISLPIADGEIYAFANDTNVIWRHGVLQSLPVKEEGRISIIAWGWMDGIAEV